MSFDPLECANRYNKPMVEVFLDILNTTNNTKYVEADLVIGSPVVIQGLTTTVELSAVIDPPGTPTVPVTYDRMSLEVGFHEVGLVVDVVNDTAETIHAALSEQYGIYIDADHFETVVDAQLGVAVLTALDTHLIWVGSFTVKLAPIGELLGRPFKTRLQVQSYYMHDVGKLPIETLKDPSLDLDDGFNLVNKLRTDDLLAANAPFVAYLARKVGMPLVSDATAPARFNLYQSQVLYNGFNSGTWFTGQARYSHVLALRISEHWCENLNGIWVIPYTDPTAFRYSAFCVSDKPLLSS